MKTLLFFCLILSCLVGCEKEITPPVTVPEAPVAVVEPEPVPEPEPEPEPEPQIEVLPAGAVIVDVTSVETVYIDGGRYAKWMDFAAALGVEAEWQPSVGVLVWQEQIVAVLEGVPQFQVGAETKEFVHMPVTVDGVPYVSLLELAEAMHFGSFLDGEQLYLTPETGEWTVPEGYYAPVLMYHAVSDDLWGFHELFVSPSDMEAQLQYLQENGYTTIHFSDLARIDEIEKPVLLTFDDGYLDNYTELYPLLQKYQAKATIFVITKSIDTHHLFMTTAQIREMVDSGLVDVQSHTVSHPNLDELSLEEQRFELEQSKLDVLRMTGREPYVLCYPTGRYNDDTLSVIGDYYQIGLKMNGNEYVTDEHVFEINRWYVSRYTDIWSFADMLEEG